jgi:hypothetical protein
MEVGAREFEPAPGPNAGDADKPPALRTLSEAGATLETVVKVGALLLVEDPAIAQETADLVHSEVAVSEPRAHLLAIAEAAHDEGFAGLDLILSCW